MAYYLLPGSAFFGQYSGVTVRQAPKNVWLSVTYSGWFYWGGYEVRSDSCSCLANIDDRGKWTFSPHIDAPDIPSSAYTVDNRIDKVAVRLWRLAKESEIPTGQDG